MVSQLQIKGEGGYLHHMHVDYCIVEVQYTCMPCTCTCMQQKYSNTHGYMYV